VTVVVYPQAGEGGAFYYYLPSPSDGDLVKESIDAHANSAVVLDADTTFHGVGRVGRDHATLHCWTDDVYIVPNHSGGWDIHERNAAKGSDVVTSLGADEVRYSISWKAYCFADEDEHRGYVEHRDDLPLSRIVPTLTGLLADRGVLPDRRLNEEELAAIMIDELIPFPDPSI
jgi:hypothetical protein